MTHHEDHMNEVTKTACDCDPKTCNCTDETCTCPAGECKCDHKAHSDDHVTKPSACDGEIPAVPEGADLSSPEGSGPAPVA